FKIRPLVERGFCTPIFWTSEEYTAKSIVTRIWEYAWRTVYQKDQPLGFSLREHVAQEAFVYEKTGAASRLSATDHQLLKEFYEAHANSEDYLLIFNFLYGSAASVSLGFPVFAELPEMGGLEFAKDQRNTFEV
ncbi:MAG: hypothetical protein V4616_10480, partial [Bacteroidota bacterium]